MVTIAPIKSTPFDESDYAERDFIRNSIVALQRENKDKDSTEPREKQDIASNIYQDKQAESAVAHRYSPHDAAFSSKEIKERKTRSVVSKD